MEKSDMVSVIIPVYNSVNTVGKLADRIDKVLSSINKNYEMIFVNDCSYDNSWEQLIKIKKRYNNITVINLAKNFGQQNATICGLHHCNGDIVITIDDDLQHDPEEIPLLINKLSEGFDVVFGVFENKNDKKYKNIGSYVIRKINCKIFKVKDLRFSSFRALKRSIVFEIKSLKTPYPYITGMVLSTTRNIANVFVNHNPRTCGKSNYTFPKLLNLSYNLLINYSNYPLKIVTYFGLSVSILSFFLGSFFLLRKIVLGEGLVGWTSIFVFMAFLSTIILLLFYIFGEYISRILKEISDRRQYVIRDIIK